MRIITTAEIKAGGADRNRGGAEHLRRYWTRGPGAARIGWGTPGDFTRCVTQLREHLGPRAEGYCANRHREATGMWPGDRRNRRKVKTIESVTLRELVVTRGPSLFPGTEIKKDPRDGDGDGRINDGRPNEGPAVPRAPKLPGTGRSKKPAAEKPAKKPDRKPAAKPTLARAQGPVVRRPAPGEGDRASMLAQLRSGNSMDPNTADPKVAGRIAGEQIRQRGAAIAERLAGNPRTRLYFEPAEYVPRVGMWRADVRIDGDRDGASLGIALIRPSDGALFVVADPDRPGSRAERVTVNVPKAPRGVTSGARQGRAKPLTDAQIDRRFDYWEALSQTREWGIGGPHDTTVQNTDPYTGTYTEERQRIHDELIRTALTDAIARGVPTDRQSIFMGGLGGAGKGNIQRRRDVAAMLGIDLDATGNADRPLSHLVINPDEFKERLISMGLVDTLPGLTPMESAHLVHEESSYIADQLIAAAGAMGLNVIVDKTMANASTPRFNASMLPDYDRTGVFVDVSVDKSKLSARQRYAKGVNAYETDGTGWGGRPVPPAYQDKGRAAPGVMVMSTGDNGELIEVQARSTNRRAFQTLADEDFFGRAFVFDNEGDGSTGSYPGTMTYRHP